MKKLISFLAVAVVCLTVSVSLSFADLVVSVSPASPPASILVNGQADFCIVEYMFNNTGKKPVKANLQLLDRSMISQQFYPLNEDYSPEFYAIFTGKKDAEVLGRDVFFGNPYDKKFFLEILPGQTLTIPIYLKTVIGETTDIHTVAIESPDDIYTNGAKVVGEFPLVSAGHLVSGLETATMDFSGAVYPIVDTHPIAQTSTVIWSETMSVKKGGFCQLDFNYLGKIKNASLFLDGKQVGSTMVGSTCFSFIVDEGGTYSISLEADIEPQVKHFGATLKKAVVFDRDSEIPIRATVGGKRWYELRAHPQTNELP